MRNQEVGVIFKPQTLTFEAKVSWNKREHWVKVVNKLGKNDFG